MTRRVEISDHALVRWLERTGLGDFEPIREAIAESLAAATGAALELGVGEFLVLADGLVYLVRNRTVVTVVSEDGRHQHARLLSRRSEDDGSA